MLRSRTEQGHSVETPWRSSLQCRAAWEPRGAVSQGRLIRGLGRVKPCESGALLHASSSTLLSQGSRSGYSHSYPHFCLNSFKPHFQWTMHILLLNGPWRMGEIWGLRARAGGVGLLPAVPRLRVSPPLPARSLEFLTPPQGSMADRDASTRFKLKV